jgi:hypothetical protein
MGLKDDLIKAKVEGLKVQGINPIDIDIGKGSAIEVECEFMKEAIAKFLTSVDFTITELRAPVIIEDFKIPDQNVNIKSQVTYLTYPGGSPGPASVLMGAMGGATLAKLDLAKDSNVVSRDFNINAGGGLVSTGYVYIGEDPDSQSSFDVDEEDGQREFTTVKLFREDIEELL